MHHQPVSSATAASVPALRFARVTGMYGTCHCVKAYLAGTFDEVGDARRFQGGQWLLGCGADEREYREPAGQLVEESLAAVERELAASFAASLIVAAGRAC